jgi:hypothetical protein
MNRVPYPVTNMMVEQTTMTDIQILSLVFAAIVAMTPNDSGSDSI